MKKEMQGLEMVSLFQQEMVCTPILPHWYTPKLQLLLPAPLLPTFCKAGTTLCDVAAAQMLTHMEIIILVKMYGFLMFPDT